MRISKWCWVVFAWVWLGCGAASASLTIYSGNPQVAAGVAVFELHDPYAPGDAAGNPFLVEYGRAKSVFGPSDKVYLSIGFDLQRLTAADMVQDAGGTKWAPRIWWQIWAPGANTSGAPTWQRVSAYEDRWYNDDAAINSLHEAQLAWPAYQGPAYYDTYFTGVGDDPADYDLWSIGGGFQSGTWSYRVSVEVPDANKDPWITLQGDGTWTGAFTPDLIAGQPLSGARSAVPEPASVLLIVVGLVAAAGVHRRA